MLKVLFFPCILQENLNLPRGPVQSGAMWRAQARQQLAVHSCKVWGHGIPKPHIFVTVVTRVRDKSSCFTTLVFDAVMSFLIKEFGMKDVQTARFANDKGTHYLSRTTLGWMASNAVEKLRSSNGTAEPLAKPKTYGMAKVLGDLGCSQHTKGAEDRYFALLEQRLALAETSRKIYNADHVLDIWRKAAAAASVPSRFKEYFIDYLPQVSKDLGDVFIFLGMFSRYGRLFFIFLGMFSRYAVLHAFPCILL